MSVKKPFVKRKSVLSIDRKRTEEPLPSLDEIDQLAERWNLNEDAREKLEIIPRKVFNVIREKFTYPDGCDNISGMLIGFASSICRNMGVRQPNLSKKDKIEAGRMEGRTEVYKASVARQRSPVYRAPKPAAKMAVPQKRAQAKSTAPSADKQKKNLNNSADPVQNFIQHWKLYPKCGPQLRALAANQRAFTIKHFHSSSIHPSEIHSHFQDFVDGLADIAHHSTAEPEEVDEIQMEEPELELVESEIGEEPEIVETPKKFNKVVERPTQQDIDDFIMIYDLNDDSRGKLESISSKSLSIVLEKFKKPPGVIECNGILINFCNAVEKASKGKGKGGKGKNNRGGKGVVRRQGKKP